MPSTVPKSMIDTSVIGDWIVISMKVKKFGKENDKVKEELNKIWKNYPKAKGAFELMEKIKKSKKCYKKFLMCDLSAAELFKIIKDEFTFQKLSELRIPFKYWLKKSVAEKIKFTKEEENIILDEIIEFFKEFFEQKKMIFVELSLGKEIGIMFDLIFRDKCPVSDAVLISTAIDNGCKFFITQDGELIRKLKRKKEIKVISPQEFLTKFGHLIK